jgi:hypothetical protein
LLIDLEPSVELERLPDPDADPDAEPRAGLLLGMSGLETGLVVLEEREEALGLGEDGTEKELKKSETEPLEEGRRTRG